MQTATQLLKAPGAGTATQPDQAPGSVPDVLPSGAGDADLSVEQTLTGRVVQSSSGSDRTTGTVLPGRVPRQRAQQGRVCRSRSI